jgi:hypothetical protein
MFDTYAWIATRWMQVTAETVSQQEGQSDENKIT